MPPPFINSEEDERVEETLTDQDLTEYTIKVPPPLVQKDKPPSQINYVMLKALLSNKEKLLELANTRLNENYSAIILKKLPEKLGHPGKFIIPCGFNELKCKALADLGASINLMPLSVWKKVPLILRRPFLRTARALIDVHEEEMILHDDDERLTLSMRHDTSCYSNQPQKESINMINIYDDSCEDYLEDLFATATNHLSGNPTFPSHTNLTLPEVKDDIFDPGGDIVLIEKLLNLDSTKDLPPIYNINPLSGKPTSASSNQLLEEFADELALITFPPGNDDLPFDIESDLREIEYFLNHDPSAYNDPFDSKEEKIKESKLLIGELDPPRSSDLLPSLEYDSFLFEDFSEVDTLPSTDNEDKVFNPGILIHENLFEVIVQVTPDKNVKKIAISHASSILKYFDPPLSYKLPFHKEVLKFKTLLSFSSKNKEKVFEPRILTSKGVHASLLSDLSHRAPKAFEVIKILESPMEIFPCSHGEDIRILDVSCLYFYPHEQINSRVGSS
nr:reverse transcriptase domain-containing protein [Tanacetum cinerariifolium]